MKTTIELPDALLRAAKMQAIDEGTTLRELVISGLQMRLFGGSASASDSTVMVNESPTSTKDLQHFDQAGWPIVERQAGDTTEVTDAMVDDLRAELGV